MSSLVIGATDLVFHSGHWKNQSEVSVVNMIPQDLIEQLAHESRHATRYRREIRLGD
jgi:endonuclease IV